MANFGSIHYFLMKFWSMLLIISNPLLIFPAQCLCEGDLVLLARDLSVPARRVLRAAARVVARVLALIPLIAVHGIENLLPRAAIRGIEPIGFTRACTACHGCRRTRSSSSQGGKAHGNHLTTGTDLSWICMHQPSVLQARTCTCGIPTASAPTCRSHAGVRSR